MGPGAPSLSLNFPTCKMWLGVPTLLVDSEEWDQYLEEPVCAQLLADPLLEVLMTTKKL